MQFAAVYDALVSADRGRQLTVIAQSDSVISAFFVLYALYFLCLTLAKLMVLDGLFQYVFDRASFASTTPSGLKLLKTGHTAAAATVCACNAVGLVGNSVAAYFFSHGADVEAAAAVDYSLCRAGANSTLAEASRFFTLGNAANSVQNYSEATVLVIIIVVFAAAAVAVTRILNTADALASGLMVQAQQANQQVIHEAAAAAAAAGSRMRSRITATVRVCFASFLFRSMWSLLVAVSQSGYDYNPACGEYPMGQCSTCQPVAVAIRFTLFYTPEVQMLVELVSSPLPLSFALWGMTSDRDRKELYGL